MGQPQIPALRSAGAGTERTPADSPTFTSESDRSDLSIHPAIIQEQQAARADIARFVVARL